MLNIDFSAKPRMSIDLFGTPPTLRDIKAEREALTEKKNSHISALGWVTIQFVALGLSKMLPSALWAVMLFCSLAMLIVVCHGLVRIFGQINQMLQLTCEEREQLSRLIEHAPVAVAYVERVAAVGRGLIGMELAAIAAETRRVGQP